jgi:phospholipid/cholesterol/gamma-HCH transport system permease protein
VADGSLRCGGAEGDQLGQQPWRLDHLYVFGLSEDLPAQAAYEGPRATLADRGGFRADHHSGGALHGHGPGLQSYHALVKFGSQGALGTLVALSLIRELGPVLTAIMITARAGSAITAEIGSQRISEQIDALGTMRIDPLRYLISPRVAASIISFPLLTAIFDVVGIIGGYISGVMLLGVNAGTYLYRVESSVDLKDVTDGFVKAIVFAVIVTTVCCYQGYFAHMRSDSYGARAIGRSTTAAVVISCVLILIADYIVTSLLI